MVVKIYEKLAAFIQDFEKVRAQVDRAGTVFLERQSKPNIDFLFKTFFHRKIMPSGLLVIPIRKGLKVMFNNQSSKKIPDSTPAEFKRFIKVIGQLA